MQILSIYLSLINALALLLMLADKQRAKKHRSNLMKEEVPRLIREVSRVRIVPMP